MYSPRRQRTQSYCGREDTAVDKLVEVGKLISDQGYSDEYYSLMGALAVYDKSMMVKLFTRVQEIVKDQILREYLFQKQILIIDELIHLVTELPCEFVSTLAICGEGSKRIDISVESFDRKKTIKFVSILAKTFDTERILELVLLQRNYKLYSKLCTKFGMECTSVVTKIRADYCPEILSVNPDLNVVLAVIESGNVEAAIIQLTRYHLSEPDISAVCSALCHNSTSNGKMIFNHVYTTYVMVETKYSNKYKKELLCSGVKYRRFDILNLILDTIKNKQLDIRCLNHHETLTEELISHYKLTPIDTKSPRSIDIKIDATLDIVMLLEQHNVTFSKPNKIR